MASSHDPETIFTYSHNLNIFHSFHSQSSNTAARPSHEDSGMKVWFWENRCAVCEVAVAAENAHGFLSISLFIGSGLIGCGAKPADAPKAELHPFTGIVLVDSEPASGAIVTLHAVGDSPLGAVTPNGVADDIVCSASALMHRETEYQPASIRSRCPGPRS